MALKMEHSLMIGLAVAAGVFGIYQIHMPPVASVRASAANNQHIDASRQSSTIISAALVTLVGLLTRDPAVFVIGGVAVVALDSSHRLANATDHQSGKLPPASGSAAGINQVTTGTS